MEVIHGALLELIVGASGQVARQVVLFENLRKMGEVVFAYIGFEVVDHMCNWGGTAPAIKGLFVEGKD